MTNRKFDSVASELFEDVKRQIGYSGQDYDASRDVLARFRLDAAALGVEPRQAVGIALRKQLAAIERYIRDGELTTEPLRSRLIDSIAYLVFLGALDQEGE